GVIDLTGAGEDRREHAEDVESTDSSKPAKKRSILPVLIVVAIAGLSAAGYVGYGLYQKLFATGEISRSGGVSLIDTALSAEPKQSLPGIETAGTGSTLPISNSGNGGAPVDDDLAPFVTVTGPSPEAVPAVNPVGVAVAVPQQPVAAPATPTVAPPLAAVAKTPVAPITVAPAEIKPTVVSGSAPAVAVAVASPVARPTPALRSPAVEAPVQKRRPAARNQVAKRPAREYISAVRSRPPRAAVATQNGTNDLGRLLNYTLLAIEPKHGSFQQAWVRDATGKVRIVAKGDLIDGARVTDVQFALGRVMTDRGEMRK
ncbi:MAG: hypothetical protein Q7V53_03095, partial [Caldisericota bacterium]|nr:hypothetical protein [Caldisericota bacterium]